MTNQEETKRLEEISRLGLHHLDKDAVLQGMVDEAAHALDMPTALISIVLDSSQQFAASHGLTGWLAQTGGTPREWSFCTHAVEKKEDFIVDDATKHPVVRENPLVEIEGVRCYAGIPLVTTRGYAVGTLCVLGSKQHHFNGTELAKLRHLAGLVMQRIEELAANKKLSQRK